MHFDATSRFEPERKFPKPAPPRLIYTSSPHQNFYDQRSVASRCVFLIDTTFSPRCQTVDSSVLRVRFSSSSVVTYYLCG
jgi:hypothetical protein